MAGRFVDFLRHYFACHQWSVRLVFLLPVVVLTSTQGVEIDGLRGLFGIRGIGALK